MFQKITLIIACVFLFSCSEKKPLSIPPTILPKEKMVEVMVDIHLLEASINLSISYADKITPGNPNPTPNFDILTKNKITKKQYDDSFDFYTQHPELLNEVYEQVLSDLSKMQAQVTNKK
jgi:hypothetical protein